MNEQSPAPCPHCAPHHRDPRQVAWGVRVAPEVDGDGQPTHLRVERADGSHVSQSDADWLYWFIAEHAHQSAYPTP